MKTAALVARLLLGLMFVVFGMNGFLHFIPQPPPPPGDATNFLTSMSNTHYMVPVFAIQLIAGALLLSGQYIPLALTIIAPVIVNILLYHGLMDVKGIPPGGIALVLWLIVFAAYREAFMGILQRSPKPVEAR